MPTPLSGCSCFRSASWAWPFTASWRSSILPSLCPSVCWPHRSGFSRRWEFGPDLTCGAGTHFDSLRSLRAGFAREADALRLFPAP
ncbi:exported hypothetical protein [Candidatus Sulfotelmatobacter kueseliae]|uniref:Uncharacterized protein n=1 Tax=Candidatus Sulfotelmatobacter kueseliae TaxID=2042962 RepID=A0A2U3KVI8_9BACT|nr:exported hypothetical protein [Candidatus Sulfotelmatobacter kueseliae]